MKENEEVKQERPLLKRIFSTLLALAVFGSVAFAGIATSIVVFEMFFGTVNEGVLTTGFATPADMTKGDLVSIQGQFDNNANQQQTITPKATFISDTTFSSPTELGAITLGGNAGACVLSTTDVVSDTLTCTFPAYTLDADGGAAETTGDITLDFELPLMWDGSELGLNMAYS